MTDAGVIGYIFHGYIFVGDILGYIFIFYLGDSSRWSDRAIRVHRKRCYNKQAIPILRYALIGTTCLL